MTFIKQNQSANVKDAGLIASGSREELPFIQQGNHQLLDARIVHPVLQVGRDYSIRLKGGIEEYGFKQGEKGVVAENTHNGMNDLSASVVLLLNPNLFL